MAAKTDVQPFRKFTGTQRLSDQLLGHQVFTPTAAPKIDHSYDIDLQFNELKMEIQGSLVGEHWKNMHSERVLFENAVDLVTQYLLL